MRATIFLGAGLVAICATFHDASAQRYTNYPVCAVYGLRTTSCAFNTMAQCYASISGRGGYCVLNDAYVPPRKKRARGS
jgi:hypothetical protein